MTEQNCLKLHFQEKKKAEEDVRRRDELEAARRAKAEQEKCVFSTIYKFFMKIY